MNSFAEESDLTELNDILITGPDVQITEFFIFSKSPVATESEHLFQRCSFIFDMLTFDISDTITIGALAGDGVGLPVALPIRGAYRRLIGEASERIEAVDGVVTPLPGTNLGEYFVEFDTAQLASAGDDMDRVAIVFTATAIGDNLVGNTHVVGYQPRHAGVGYLRQRTTI